MKKLLLLLAQLFFVLLGASVSMFGQGAFIPPQTAFKEINGIVMPIANATITVCAGNAGGIPCSPALTNTIFQDIALTEALPNPFTTDAYGNYQFAAMPSTYTVTVTSQGFAGYSYQITMGTGSGGGVGGSGAPPFFPIWTGSTTLGDSNLSNVTGGVNYTLGGGLSWQVNTFGATWDSGVTASGSSNIILANTFAPGSNVNAGGIELEGANATGSACAGLAALVGGQTNSTGNGASITANGACSNGFGAIGGSITLQGGNVSTTNNGGNINLIPGTAGSVPSGGYVYVPAPLQITATTTANLPSCGGYGGLIRSVSDASVNTWGSTFTGGGSDKILAYCDGTNWTVMGAAGAGAGVIFQTNGTNNTVQSTLNFLTSTTNAEGLTATPVYFTGGGEKIEISGVANLAAAFNTTPTICAASNAPRGVDVSGNALNCTQYFAATITSPAPTQTISYNGSAWVNGYAGVNVDPQTGDYTFTCPTDRLGEIEFNISAAKGFYLPQAGSSACLGSSMAMVVRNTSTSTANLTVCAGTGSSGSCSAGASDFLPEAAASKTVAPGAALLIYSDATSSTGNYHAIPLGVTGGGSGTVTGFSAGNLSPLFTTSVATATTTPALSFSLTNAAANTIFANFTGSSAAPSFSTINSGSSCGDGTHALSYTNGTGFGCQAITVGTGTVTGVTGVAPIASTGGSTPAISLQNSGSANVTAAYGTDTAYFTASGGASTSGDVMVGDTSGGIKDSGTLLSSLSGGITCSGTCAANHLAKFATSSTVNDSGLSDNGTTLSAAELLSLTPAFGGTNTAVLTANNQPSSCSPTGSNFLTPPNHCLGTTSNLTVGTDTTSGVMAGGYFSLISGFNSASTPYLAGVYGFATTTNGNTGVPAALAGVVGVGQLQEGVNVTNLTGLWGISYIPSGDSGTATLMSGVIGQINDSAFSGTVTASAALYAMSPTISNPVTNNYGLYIADQTVGGGTNNPSPYSLYAAGTAPSYFGGSITSLGYISAGTKFTASGCSNGTTVGGATAGSFASGTTGTCTVTVTMGSSATSVNGWACSVSDQTTANLMRETASNTTTATLSGTTVSGDVIVFGCIGY